MRYWIEKLYPLTIALMIAYFFWASYDIIKLPDEFIKKLVDSALVVCATLLGFLLTITTIMNAISSRRMTFIKSHRDGYPTLVSYLRWAIWLNIITVTMAIVVPVIYAIENLKETMQYHHALIVFIISFTWISSIRFTVIFVKILSDE